LNILSENLSRSVKRLKRDIENNLKNDKTDVEACFEKLKLEKRAFVYPLEKEFQLSGVTKSKEFGTKSTNLKILIKSFRF
jgi:hypothetical protein